MIATLLRSLLVAMPAFLRTVTVFAQVTLTQSTPWSRTSTAAPRPPGGSPGVSTQARVCRERFSTRHKRAMAGVTIITWTATTRHSDHRQSFSVEMSVSVQTPCAEATPSAPTSRMSGHAMKASSVSATTGVTAPYTD